MENQKKARKFRSKEEISEILRRYEESGKGQIMFSRMEGISPSTLRNWVYSRAKKKSGKQPDWFVRVKLPAEPKHSGCMMELKFPGGSSLQFYNEPRAEFIKSLLSF